MKKYLVFCLILIIFLVACSQKNPEKAVIVEYITVSGPSVDACYTNATKMSQILNSIRTLGQKSTATTDPEALPELGWRITLHRSDGSELTYRTKGARYFRQGDQPWQEVDPKKLEELDILLRSLPGDN